MALVRVCHNIYIPGQFVVGRVEHRVLPEVEFWNWDVCMFVDNSALGVGVDEDMFGNWCDERCGIHQNSRW